MKVKINGLGQRRECQSIAPYPEIFQVAELIEKHDFFSVVRWGDKEFRIQNQFLEEVVEVSPDRNS